MDLAHDAVLLAVATGDSVTGVWALDAVS
jgi:hypothetical protein